MAACGQTVPITVLLDMFKVRSRRKKDKEAFNKTYSMFSEAIHSVIATKTLCTWFKLQENRKLKCFRGLRVLSGTLILSKNSLALDAKSRLKSGNLA